MSELALFRNAGSARPNRILWPGGAIGDPEALLVWGQKGESAIHSTSGNVLIKNNYQVVLLDSKPAWVALKGPKASFQASRLLAVSEFAYLNPNLKRIACASCEDLVGNSFYALSGELGAADVYSASCAADTVTSVRPPVDESGVGGMYGQWQVFHYAPCLSSPDGSSNIGTRGLSAYSIDLRKSPAFIRAAVNEVDCRVLGELYQMYYSDSWRLSFFFRGHPDYMASTPAAGLHYYPSSFMSAAYAINKDRGYTGVAVKMVTHATNEFMYEGRPDGFFTLRETNTLEYSSVHHVFGPVGTVLTYRKEAT